MNTECNDYKPDIIAQGDCINCGHTWESHQNTECACGAIAVMQLAKTLKRSPSPRKPQVKLTVTVNDRLGGIVPQVILIPGETRMCDLDQVVRKAVNEQTIAYGAAILKMEYRP